jgi:hypothetical protein
MHKRCGAAFALSTFAATAKSGDRRNTATWDGTVIKKNVSGLGEAFEKTTFILRRKADQFHKSVYIIQIFTTYEMSE